jgi:hypothetical protein
MCRNIRPLYNFEPAVDDDEVRAAAAQYVRKISGFTRPSQVNTEAFERAVDAVAAASTQLLDALVTTTPPKNREVEAAKARARGATVRSLSFGAGSRRAHDPGGDRRPRAPTALAGSIEQPSSRMIPARRPSACRRSPLDDHSLGGWPKG